MSGTKRVLIEMEINAVEIGTHLPVLRNLLSLRRKEQHSQSYRKLFLQMITNDKLRNKIIYTQNQYLLQMIL